MTDWSKFSTEMVQEKAKHEAVAQSLSPEEREKYYQYTRDLLTAFSAPAEFSFEKFNEQAIRREWATKIREEFGKYHEHAETGECGACGAIQAANYMDPDYVGDGPKEERS